MPTFLNPVLPLKHLDLNTEKPNLPQVWEPHQSGGIYTEAEHPIHVTVFYNHFQ